MAMPNAACTLALESTELCGRFAGSGYSSVLIPTTRFVFKGPLNSAVSPAAGANASYSSRIACAKPAQDVLPAAVR